MKLKEAAHLNWPNWGDLQSKDASLVDMALTLLRLKEEGICNFEFVENNDKEFRLEFDITEKGDEIFGILHNEIRNSKS